MAVTIEETRAKVDDLPLVSKILLGTVFVHGVVWALVGMLLFTINLLTTFLIPPWFIFPVLGWGIGLGAHAAAIAVVMVAMGRGSDLGMIHTQGASAVKAIMAAAQPVVAAVQTKVADHQKATKAAEREKPE
eukprot:CAMPEP_0172573484 /NCGR_PEP_ID=MMETSP1067-20121228/136213_1 /TAXON_ID=265564 ORGANISM="Thalassiosira punctigera, Strain Tpunct2005C2" /NCGR_SAMPLE_ID=MMETSP1067 /ASSEMBLY_ACC=CAM_ASM_000444 /LENGTH=131 /DNA_ID=CAMNT_0013366089 /DNA_START=58 /DNA_END=453 /DNA_ORIENTATION=+